MLFSPLKMSLYSESNLVWGKDKEIVQNLINLHLRDKLFFWQYFIVIYIHMYNTCIKILDIKLPVNLC